MIKELPQLYELQQVDTQIGQLLIQKGRLDDGSQLQAQLETKRQVYQEHAAQLRDLEGRHQALELEIRGVKEKRAAEERRYYQAKGVKAREVDHLQKEIEALHHRQDFLETELLEVMMQLDLLRPQVEQERQEVEKLERELAAVLERYHREVVGFDEELAALGKVRQEKAAKISPPTRKRYDAIRQRADNLAIVLVTDNVCPGCKINLTPFKLRQLQEQKQVQYCESCNRILYWTGQARPRLTAADLGIEIEPDEGEITASDYRRGRSRIQRDEKDGKAPG